MHVSMSMGCMGAQGAHDETAAVMHHWIHSAYYYKLSLKLFTFDPIIVRIRQNWMRGTQPSSPPAASQAHPMHLGLAHHASNDVVRLGVQWEGLEGMGVVSPVCMGRGYTGAVLGRDVAGRCEHAQGSTRVCADGSLLWQHQHH